MISLYFVASEDTNVVARDKCVAGNALSRTKCEEEEEEEEVDDSSDDDLLTLSEFSPLAERRRRATAATSAERALKRTPTSARRAQKSRAAEAPAAARLSFRERARAHSLLHCGVGACISVARDNDSQPELRTARVVDVITNTATRRVRLHFDGLSAECDETIAVCDPRLRRVIGDGAISPRGAQARRRSGRGAAPSPRGGAPPALSWIAPTERITVPTWGAAAVGLHVLLIETVDDPEERVEVREYDPRHIGREGTPEPYQVYYLDGAHKVRDFDYRCIFLCVRVAHPSHLCIC